MKALSSCDPPLSATAGSTAPHALLSPCTANICRGTQEAKLRMLPGSDKCWQRIASAPWEQKLTSPTRSHMKLEGTVRSRPPLTSVPSLHVEEAEGERPAGSLPSPFRTPQLLFPLHRVCVDGESCELWAISCWNRASFSNWDSICSLQAKEVMPGGPLGGRVSQPSPLRGLRWTTPISSHCSTSFLINPRSGQGFLNQWVSQFYSLRNF